MEKLTEAEWQVMEKLWEKSPQSGRELTQSLEISKGWNRSTTLTLLARLEKKGAVESSRENGKKQFSPVLERENAAMEETRSFLDRVYQGSVGLMLSAMTQK